MAPHGEKRGGGPSELNTESAVGVRNEEKDANVTHFLGSGVWRSCGVGSKGLIEMMHPAVTTEDWSLMDCQEYFVDLEMSLTGVATALEVSAPGQLRDDQMGIYRELELEVGVARGLANKLRAKHLEEYDLHWRPVAFADPCGITEKLKAGRLRLNAKLSASLGARHGEQAAMILQQRLRQGEGSRKPSALPPSPLGQGDSLEGAWPWFSGRLEDLSWFWRAREENVRRFHHGLALEVLVGGAYGSIAWLVK